MNAHHVLQPCFQRLQQFFRVGSNKNCLDDGVHFRGLRLRLNIHPRWLVMLPSPTVDSLVSDNRQKPCSRIIHPFDPTTPNPSFGHRLLDDVFRQAGVAHSVGG